MSVIFWLKQVNHYLLESHPLFNLNFPDVIVCLHNHKCASFVLCVCRTFSENDCTMVAPADPCLSPTKGELVYSKTAKQCLEEISGTHRV